MKLLVDYIDFGDSQAQKPIFQRQPKTLHPRTRMRRPAARRLHPLPGSSVGMQIGDVSQLLVWGDKCRSPLSEEA